MCVYVFVCVCVCVSAHVLVHILRLKSLEVTKSLVYTLPPINNLHHKGWLDMRALSYRHLPSLIQNRLTNKQTRRVLYRPYSLSLLKEDASLEQRDQL